MGTWNGRKPSLKDEHVGEMQDIRRLMAQLPFDVAPRGEGLKRLAERWGVSLQTVRDYLGHRLPKRFGGDGGR
jgi:hypothetical protein